MMNCESFQELLFEHLDGTLVPGVHKEAEQHLESCEECRDILARQKLLASEVSQQMHQATENLRLTRAAHQRIRAASERPSWPEHLAAIWLQLSWRWGLAALLLCAIAILGAREFRTGNVPAAHKSELPVMVSLRVPQVLACYTFRNEGGFVVDTLLYRTNVLNAECRIKSAE